MLSSPSVLELNKVEKKSQHKQKTLFQQKELTSETVSIKRL